MFVSSAALLTHLGFGHLRPPGQRLRIAAWLATFPNPPKLLHDWAAFVPELWLFSRGPVGRGLKLPLVLAASEENMIHSLHGLWRFGPTEQGAAPETGEVQE